jgi:hypothetical protein
VPTIDKRRFLTPYRPNIQKDLPDEVLSRS